MWAYFIFLGGVLIAAIALAVWSHKNRSDTEGKAKGELMVHSQLFNELHEVMGTMEKDATHQDERRR